MQTYYDVAIIVPLTEEFEVALEIFEFQNDVSDSDQLRFEVTLPGNDLSILLIKQQSMGKFSSAEAASLILNDTKVGLFCCVGIAGGLSNDVNIGDICYSGTIVDVLENAKISDTTDGSSSIALSTNFYETPREISVILTRDKLAPATRIHYQKWQSQQEALALIKIPGNFTGKGQKVEKIAQPRALEGLIACGFVSGSPSYNEKIKGIDRKILAIETESGGIFHISKQHSTACLTVRGISDYAGVDKNKFELETNNSGRYIAAHNAFTFMALSLNSAMLGGYIKAIKEQFVTGNNSLKTNNKIDPVVDAILRLEALYSEKLRELAPGYSLQPKGYRLPVPRVKVSDQSSARPESRETHPTEIRDILENNRIVTISVPRQYPDYSLPWIIASELLRSHSGRQQVVSYVIRGDEIKAPQGNITSLVPDYIRNLIGNSGCKLVIVIDDFRFESARRVDFFTEQLEESKEISFIIVSRYHSNLLSETNFISATGSIQADLCDVSFFEIVHFLQKNFELTPTASEVVATRLRETFSNFDLSAHPTYFVGIPRNVLDALLQANKRAELIQLAVLGYLTLLVASESASGDSISLSRTTREEFLSQIAVEINLSKKDRTEAELVLLVETMAIENDFDISAVKFVKKFYDKGILHNIDGKVRFSLQFMEAYLVAKHLEQHPGDALKYFSKDAEDFDYPTFTLYAELGPSNDVLAHVFTNLDMSIKELISRRANYSILASDKLRPVLLEKQQRMQHVQKQLHQAMFDAKEEKDKTAEKQKLLDAADRVRERAVRKQDRSRDDGAETLASKYKVEQDAFHVFALTANLLGSGAERLSATTKRKLIEKLITLSALIIEDWTHLVFRVDFAELKAEIAKEDNLIDEFASEETEQQRRAAEHLLLSLVDFIEYTLLMQPFRVISAGLCEEAHDAVLAESIIKSKADGNLENLIKCMWLCDVDTTRGRQPLTAAVKRFPKAKFLRVSLASHLIERVYWKHWRKADRLALLDIAQLSFEAIGQTFNKGAVKRFLEKPSNK